MIRRRSRFAPSRAAGRRPGRRTSRTSRVSSSPAPTAGPVPAGPAAAPLPWPRRSQPTGAYPQPGYAPTGPYPVHRPPPRRSTPTWTGAAPPQQHGAPAEPTAEPTPAKSKKKLLAIVGGVLVLIIAVVAITGFWKPGFFWTRTLDVNSVQAGVLQILTDPSSGYGQRQQRPLQWRSEPRRQDRTHV